VKTSDIIISLIQEELEKKLNNQSDNPKLWIFDFDDTLVTSKSQVIVKDAEGNVVEKIDTGDYPTHKLKPGQEYDFSEFSKVINPERIEGVFRTFVEQINDSSSKVYILTARQPDAAEAIFNYLLKKKKKMLN
jgi:FMN phosphatase YigB (HAD superfamily)